MRTETTSPVAVKVADAVWIATALLHREHSQRGDFALQEIVDRVEAEPRVGRHKRTTVYAHVTQHCVANVSPSSGRYRMLFETSKGRRRLFRPGDPFDRSRTGKMTPDAHVIPREFRMLVEWYRAEYSGSSPSVEDRLKNDPILAMRGLGK